MLQCCVFSSYASLPALGALPELEHLAINWNWMQVETLKAIVSNSPRLQSLKMHGIYRMQLSEDSLLELSKLPELKKLKLFRCHVLKDAVLKAIARQGKLEVYTYY